MIPQASASFRLLTRPACEQALSAGLRYDASGNTSASLGAGSSLSWWRACSRRTWLAVSRTKATEIAKAVRAIPAAPATRTSLGAKSAASHPLIAAATATPPYPAASFRPSASPRRFGPTRSIFMTTVIDHASPWLMPSSALAATIQAQLGATAISSGTGSATVQPTISRRRRPSRSAPTPAARLVNDLARPNATMNDRTAALDVSPKSVSPMSGRVERSSPTIAPTNALTATSSENWGRFSRSPSRTAGRVAKAATRRRASERGHRPHRRRARDPASGAVRDDDVSLPRRCGRDVMNKGVHERLLGVVLQRLVVPALEPDRRGRMPGEAAAADRAGVVSGVEQQVVRQAQHALVERAIQRPGHLLDAVATVRVQVRPAGVPDQQRVAGEHHPWIVGPGVVGDQVRVMGVGVPGGGDRLELRVAEPHHLAVVDGVVVELDACAPGEVRRGARAGHELGQAGDVIGLHVRLEDGDDRRALGLGERDVSIDQVGVWIDHGEPAVALAAKQVRGAG